jgi:hypothetical protein
MTAFELYTFIREINLFTPGLVTSAEQLAKLRSQINHHLVVGILFDKAPSDVTEIERAFGVMQNKYPNFRFALVSDPSVLPEDIAQQAVSSIILYRHPIFEPLLGAFEDVIISYRVDADKYVARMLWDALSRLGVNAFLDKHCLRAGYEWKKSFIAGLQRSRRFVPIISRGALSNVRDYARDHDKDNVFSLVEVHRDEPLVPVLHPPAEIRVFSGHARGAKYGSRSEIDK